MPRSRLVALLAGLSAVLAVAAVWFLLHNPSVESASMGSYTCTAPYDTVLNDADNVPGGEPPPDAHEVEARCIDSGQARFAGGLASGAAALLVAATTGVIGRGARLRSSA